MNHKINFKILGTSRRKPRPDDDGFCKWRWHRGSETIQDHQCWWHFQQCTSSLHTSLRPHGHTSGWLPDAGSLWLTPKQESQYLHPFLQSGEGSGRWHVHRYIIFFFAFAWRVSLHTRPQSLSFKSAPSLVLAAGRFTACTHWVRQLRAPRILETGTRKYTNPMALSISLIR